MHDAHARDGAQTETPLSFLPATLTTPVVGEALGEPVSVHIGEEVETRRPDEGSGQRVEGHVLGERPRRAAQQRGKIPVPNIPGPPSVPGSPETEERLGLIRRSFSSGRRHGRSAGEPQSACGGHDGARV